MRLIQGANKRFMQKIDSFVYPIFRKTIQHPFLQELSDGSLNKLKFRVYLNVDRFYLLSYCDALLRLSQYASLPGDQLSLKEFSDCCKAEPAFKVTDIEYVADPSGETLSQEYIDFINSHTMYKDTYREGLSSVFPCFYIYYRVGKELSPKNKNSEYASWFDVYRSELFMKQTEKIIEMLEKEYCSCNQRQQNAMERIIEEGSLREYKFWDKAYYGAPIESILCLR